MFSQWCSEQDWSAYSEQCFEVWYCEEWYSQGLGSDTANGLAIDPQTWQGTPAASVSPDPPKSKNALKNKKRRTQKYFKRKVGQTYCKYCRFDYNSHSQWLDHLEGKKHLQQFEAWKYARSGEFEETAPVCSTPEPEPQKITETWLWLESGKADKEAQDEPEEKPIEEKVRKQTRRSSSKTKRQREIGRMLRACEEFDNCCEAFFGRKEAAKDAHQETEPQTAPQPQSPLHQQVKAEGDTNWIKFQ